jgi:hypothetical protein
LNILAVIALEGAENKRLGKSFVLNILAKVFGMNGLANGICRTGWTKSGFCYRFPVSSFQFPVPSCQLRAVSFLTLLLFPW